VRVRAALVLVLDRSVASRALRASPWSCSSHVTDAPYLQVHGGYFRVDLDASDATTLETISFVGLTGARILTLRPSTLAAVI
jgi:hypothetical protein